MIRAADGWTRSWKGWVSTDGVWTIRGPIFGQPMFWLYRDGSRFTPTGRYNDAVSFTTAAEAKAFVERETA